MPTVKKYVTANTFEADRVVFKDIKKCTERVSYQRIPIRYIYEDDEEGPLVVQSHPVFSFGVFDSKDPVSGATNCYSFSFFTYDKNK